MLAIKNMILLLCFSATFAAAATAPCTFEAYSTPCMMEGGCRTCDAYCAWFKEEWQARNGVGTRQHGMVDPGSFRDPPPTGASLYKSCMRGCGVVDRFSVYHDAEYAAMLACYDVAHPTECDLGLQCALSLLHKSRMEAECEAQTTTIGELTYNYKYTCPTYNANNPNDFCVSNADWRAVDGYPCYIQSVALNNVPVSDPWCEVYGDEVGPTGRTAHQDCCECGGGVASSTGRRLLFGAQGAHGSSSTNDDPCSSCPAHQVERICFDVSEDGSLSGAAVVTHVEEVHEECDVDLCGVQRISVVDPQPDGCVGLQFSSVTQTADTVTVEVESFLPLQGNENALPEVLAAEMAAMAYDFTPAYLLDREGDIRTAFEIAAEDPAIQIIVKWPMPESVGDGREVIMGAAITAEMITEYGVEGVEINRVDGIGSNGKTYRILCSGGEEEQGWCVLLEENTGQQERRRRRLLYHSGPSCCRRTDRCTCMGSNVVGLVGPNQGCLEDHDCADLICPTLFFEGQSVTPIAVCAASQTHTVFAALFAAVVAALFAN